MKWLAQLLISIAIFLIVFAIIAFIGNFTIGYERIYYYIGTFAISYASAIIAGRILDRIGKGEKK